MLALLVATLQGSVHGHERAAGGRNPVHHPRVGDLVVERGRGQRGGHGAQAVQRFQQGDGLVARGDVVRALWVRKRRDVRKIPQAGSPLPPRQPIPTATSPGPLGSFPGNRHTFHSGLQRWCDAPGKFPEQCLRDWAFPGCAFKSWARRVTKQAPKTPLENMFGFFPLKALPVVQRPFQLNEHPTCAPSHEQAAFHSTTSVTEAELKEGNMCAPAERWFLRPTPIPLLPCPLAVNTGSMHSHLC